MARILFCMPPLTGHINPARAVACQLELRGHTVAWAVGGDFDGGFAAVDRVYRLPNRFAGKFVRTAHDVRGLESVRLFFEDFCLPLAAATLPALEKVVAGFKPDVMVCDQQMLAGAIAARKLSIPWLTSATTSASIAKMPPLIETWLVRQLFDLQQASGIAVPVVRPDIAPDGVIVFSSEALSGRQPRLEAAYHFIGPAFSHREKSVDFPWRQLHETRRKIFISLGTVSRDRGTRFYRVMMEALADLDIQVIMAAPRWLERIAPANFIIRERVPQIQLLDCVDAVICHAGHNTVCEALAFGLPLIVAPIRDDQPVIARQVIDAGAALPMRFGKVTAAVAREKVLQLLGDSTLRANAQRLRESFNGLGGAWRAADIVESLLPIRTGHTASGAA